MSGASFSKATSFTRKLSGPGECCLANVYCTTAGAARLPGGIYRALQSGKSPGPVQGESARLVRWRPRDHTHSRSCNPGGSPAAMIRHMMLVAKARCGTIACLTGVKRLRDYLNEKSVAGGMSATASQHPLGCAGRAGGGGGSLAAGAATLDCKDDICVRRKDIHADFCCREETGGQTVQHCKPQIDTLQGDRSAERACTLEQECWDAPTLFQGQKGQRILTATSVLCKVDCLQR